MIPGSNLFLRAARVIRTVPIQYFKYESRVQNAARQWVTAYEDPETVFASVQAVPQDTYVRLGLDMQRNYVTIYAAVDIVDLARDSSGDQFEFDGIRYQMESKNGWYVMDGWASCMAVETKVLS